MCGCLSYAPIGDLTPNPGMCPEWELNQRPYGSQPVLNPLSHTGQGLYEALKKSAMQAPHLDAWGRIWVLIFLKLT